MTLSRPDVIILDLEGTTSSTGFVHDTLHPYSRERFGAWLRENHDHPDVARARAQIIEEGGLGAHVNVDTLVEQLEEWLDNDDERTPLTTLQGLIWADGFNRGDLTPRFFPDFFPAIRRWHEEGIDLKIFSAVPVNAQTSWLGNSPEGDLLPLFSGHFDTRNAGPKQLASSYATIREAIGVPADKLLFFSDLGEELDGARADSWAAVGVRREGDRHHDRGVGEHPEISSFDQALWE